MFCPCAVPEALGEAVLRTGHMCPHTVGPAVSMKTYGLRTVCALDLAKLQSVASKHVGPGGDRWREAGPWLPSRPRTEAQLPEAASPSALS